jgi:hypothetical protein
MTNPVIFKYKLSDSGTAEGMIGIGDQNVNFMFTNNGNPLADLLRGMVSLIFEPSHIWDEENIHHIDWYGETVSYKWIFSTLDGEVLNIKVIEVADLFEEGGEKVRMNNQCNFTDFYTAVIKELDIFIKDTGLLNYEQKWQKDEFPLTYFLILKKYLLEKGLWDGKKIGKNTLEREIDILMI